MKNSSNKIILSLLLILFLFLPLSAWLISLTGLPEIGLIRDALIFAILVIVVLNKFILRPIRLPLRAGSHREELDSSRSAGWRTRTMPMILALIFVIWGVLSFFWRDASSLQWLKGFRFTFMPIVLFLCLSQLQFDDKQKKILFKTILAGGLAIALIAILELFGLKIPLTSQYSKVGGLESLSLVGGINTHRLQSVVAGPNALGLYSLAIFSLLGGAINFKNKFVLWFLWIIFAAILVLTFSRSAAIGLIVLIVALILITLKQKIGMMKAAVLSAIIMIIVIASAIIIYRSPVTKDYITHADSSSFRVQQYQRIWDSKYDIGFLGRGSGTAGPSSQKRVDGGENHWTENIYLDIFEELGFIGLIIYLLLIGSLILRSGRVPDDFLGRSALLILLSFSIAGLFINYYTGQIGIYLLWLICGLLCAEQKETE